MKRWIWLGAFCAAAFAQATQPPQPSDTVKEENREAAARARMVIQRMGLKPGMTVADLNTGLGFMLPFLSRNAGPEGHVIAEDSSPDLLAGARQLAENQNLQNIEFVKGSDADPNLPEGKVDIALGLNVYHRLSAPEKMLAGVYRALKPDGRLVLVERYKNAPAANEAAAAPIRFDMPDLIKELEASHFHVVEEKERVKDVDYILIAEKKLESK